MIKAIIWDLEGVIARTKDENITVKIAKRLNIPVEKLDHVLFSDFHNRVDSGELSQDDFWAFIVRSVGLPPDRKKLIENILQEILFVDQLVVSDIQQYRRKYKTVLLSNFSEVLRPMLEDLWQVDKIFDEIIISCEVHMIKPDPRIYRYALKQLECEAYEAIFIDDKASNVESARAVGLHTFQFTGRQDMNRRIQEIIVQNP